MLNHSDVDEELITKTYIAPSGAVIVIRNLPARVVRKPDRPERISYSIDVAQKLDELLNAALMGATPSDVKEIYFGGSIEKPKADYELEFAGPEAFFADASLQVWRLIFDKAYTAVKMAVRAVASDHGKTTQVSLPRLAYVGPSSIVLGIKTTTQTYLPVLEDDPDTREKAMRLLIGTAHWLDGHEGALPSQVRENQAVLDGLLRALEELAPASDAVTTVRIKSRRDDKPPASLSKKTREAAKSRRIEIRLSMSKEERLIELSGVLARIDIRGKVILREIQPNNEWHKLTANCRYSEDLKATLLENFGKRVRVSAIQKRIADEWSDELEAVDIIREANNAT